MTRPTYAFGHDSLNPPEPQVELTTTVSLLDLMEALKELPEEQLIQFVKDLDSYQGSWHFSLELHRYFKDQKKAYKAEIKEDEQL